ncbi:MAG: PQQ-binding-like beta-propeller repeat protein [Pirellulaceae bacterium]
MLRRAQLLALVLFAALPWTAQAQIRSTGLIDPDAARQLGLERMWFTQLSLDRARGRVAGLHQHVSSSQMQVLIEFIENGVRHEYASRELEAAGRPLREVAVLAVLDEAAAVAAPLAGVPVGKFRVVQVLKGAELAAPDLVVELPYLGDAAKGKTFYITASQLIPGAKPVQLTWGNPLQLADSAQKLLMGAGALTPGVERALQNAELDLMRVRLAAARRSPQQAFADDRLPAVEARAVPDITLYATSDRGLLHALNAETGRTLWTASVGSPTLPTTAPAANDTHVAVINGSTLYVHKADDGSALWSRFTVGSPGAGPAMSDQLLFAPMISGSIETYAIEQSAAPLTIFRSFGRVLIQPVVSQSSVAWTTDRGNLYVGYADTPRIKFQMEARKSIESAPAFLAPALVFATSRDGYVYCVTEQHGGVVWRFSTGEPITHSPVAIGKMVYAITDRGNMFAIEAESGQELWPAGGIRSFVAASDQRLYCLDLSGNLAILEIASGRRIGTIPTGGLDLHYMNVQTDRIIVGSRSGLLQCLREVEARHPVLHFGGEMKPQADKSQPVKPGAKPAAPAGANPFAPPAAEDAPAGADPFGTPAAADDPFAAP